MADVWFHDVARYVYLYWYQVSLRVYYGCRYVYIRGDFFLWGIRKAQRSMCRIDGTRVHNVYSFVLFFFRGFLFNILFVCKVSRTCQESEWSSRISVRFRRCAYILIFLLHFAWQFRAMPWVKKKKKWKSQILQGKKIMLTTCSITNAHSAILLKADIILFTTGDTTCSPPLLCFSRTVVIKMCWIFLVLKTSMEHVES